MEVLERWCIVQGVVVNLAVRSCTETRSVDQFQPKPADSNHLAWSSHQKMTEIGEIIRPVRNDHRIGVIRQILSDMPGSLFATQLKVHAGRNEPKIRNDVLLPPWMNLGGKWQRNIEVMITIFGDECQTDRTEKRR